MTPHALRLTLFSLSLGVSLSTALAVLTGGSFWGWATFTLIVALGAVIATAAAGKGRP